MNAAQFFAKTLKKAGMKKVFGIPSYVGLGILKALDEEAFAIILNSHEQNAAHMAEGYYYATGELPVVSVAIGPGLTNAITGITNAFVESIPMIVVAARSASAAIGRNEYHSNSGICRNLDERMMMQSCTKQVFYLDDVSHAQQLIHDAIRTSLSGRPGPVFISIPPELQKEEMRNAKPLNSQNYMAQNIVLPDQKALLQFQESFSKAKKPLIMFGNEITSDLKKEIKKLLKGTCPYLTSYGAKGKVPILGNYLGTIWYCNSDHILNTFKESDFLVAIGEDFTHFTGRLFGAYLQEKPVIQVSSFGEEVGRCFSLEQGIVSDIDHFLKQIDLPKKPWSLKKSKKKTAPDTYSTLNIIRALGKLAPDNAVFFADVGNAGYASITDLHLKEKQDFYTTGKFGTCGWSIPTAIGYSFGNRGAPVFSIVGDLSLNMNIQELGNIKKLGTKNSIILFNNRTLQNISLDQLDIVGKTIQCDMPNLNYEAAAKTYGLDYAKVQSITELKSIFEATDFNKTQTLIEIVVDKEDYPIYE